MTSIKRASATAADHLVHRSDEHVALLLYSDDLGVLFCELRLIGNRGQTVQCPTIDVRSLSSGSYFLKCISTVSAPVIGKFTKE
ncbi:MAG: hypothetical protein M3R08_11995 [Bacteroidota bacterium]|nr:hypothetical protein [Bacteroidota bacterium]